MLGRIGIGHLLGSGLRGHLTFLGGVGLLSMLRVRA